MADITFLCVVIDRATGKELASYEITDRDDMYFSDYFARKRAAEKFTQTCRYTPRLRGFDWYVDSVQIN